MKATLIENILQGFHTEADAREAASALSEGQGVHVAEYYTSGLVSGHCVRLAMRQKDDSALRMSKLRYHEKEIRSLDVSLRLANRLCEVTHKAGDPYASDAWSEIANALGTVTQFHNEFIRRLGGDE